MDPPPLDPIEFKDAIAEYKPVLRDFFSTTAVDFSNYKAVSQGEVGDCWLLAPMAALSRSIALRSVLGERFKINDDKTYTVTLGLRDINLNGNLYMLPAEGEYRADLLFAGQQQFLPQEITVPLESLWFAFIEKAAAILYGGYHLLDGGDPDDPDVKQADLGFKLLTDKPVTTIMIDDTTDFKSIKALLTADAAIVFTTKTNKELKSRSTMKIGPSTTDKSRFNLLQDHSYVVDAISEEGILTLYNPHGEFDAIKIQNTARPLTEENAKFFGKRFDIVSSGFAGGARKRKRSHTQRKMQRGRSHTRRQLLGR